MERFLLWCGLSLVLVGLLVAGLGVLMGALGGRGRLLPGDIVISRPGFTLYFPIVTSLALSLLLSLIFWAITAWRR